MKYCSSAQFMVWADSDTVVFLENLQLYLNERQPNVLNGANMACFVMWGDVIRDANNWKYYIPAYIWPYDQLPLYCSGPFQLISQEAVNRMAVTLPKLGKTSSGSE